MVGTIMNNEKHSTNITSFSKINFISQIQMSDH